MPSMPTGRVHYGNTMSAVVPNTWPWPTYATVTLPANAV
jgi:hypothetical protein